MMSELLPCPFCGGKAKLNAYRASRDSEGCIVHCTQCNVRTKEFEDAFIPDVDAVDAWNRRTPPRAEREDNK